MTNEIFNRTNAVHNELQDGNEIAIYDKYGNISKRFTIILIRKKSIH